MIGTGLSDAGIVRQQRGATMIEVLVALLLVALGTLAIVALQLSSKRSNLDAEQRAVAAQLAMNFLERLRANNSAAALDAYLDSAIADYGGGKQGTPKVDCAAAACSDIDLAFYDAKQFELVLDGTAVRIGTDDVGGLMDPIACLSADPAGGVSAVYTVTIVWRGTGAIPNDPAVQCGSGSGKYGTSDEFRRVLSMPAYIAIR